jgi:uncharacterized protein
MLIDVNKIGAQGLLKQDSVVFDGTKLIEDGGCFLDEVHYSLHLSREGERIRAKGWVRTTVSLQCIDCLDNFEMGIDSKFDTILLPVSLMETKTRNTPLNPEEMEYIFFDGDELDLERLLMEQVNLFIPFNPTCSPYCKGICPGCGVNLNYESCQCEHHVNEMNMFFEKIKR